MSGIGLPGQSGLGAPSPDGKGLGPHSPTSPATPRPTGPSPCAARPPKQCSRPSQSQERREVVRADDARRQGARDAERAQARAQGAKAPRSAGRGHRRVGSARGRHDRGVAPVSAPERARAPRRDRRLEACPGRPPRGRAVRAAGLWRRRPRARHAWPPGLGNGGERAPVPAAKRRQRHAVVRDGWREPAPTLVVGALRPTATAARRWPRPGAPFARSRRSRPSRRYGSSMPRTGRTRAQRPAPT
jgi:hypothetical protein